MKLDISLAQLKGEVLNVFFQAMLVNYSKKEHVTEKKSIPELPGSSMLSPFFCGRYVVVHYDWLLANNSNFGNIIVYRDGTPVWQMQYSGWYLAEAVPFLKMVLRSAYRQREFYGGRGQRDLRYKQWEYFNYFHLDCDWGKFDGREIISQIDPDGEGPAKYMGSLRYQGGMLIEDLR